MNTRRTFAVRCSHCKTTNFVTTTLEDARQMRCGLCHQKTTVAGHRDNGELKPGEPSAVTKAPTDETPFWKLTAEQTDRARGLVLSALGEKE